MQIQESIALTSISHVGKNISFSGGLKLLMLLAQGLMII